MSTSQRTTRRQQAGRPLLIVWILLALLAATGVLITLKYAEPPPPNRIILAGGAPGGAYHAFARRYRDELGAAGVTVEVLDTAGSGQNMELLLRGEADIAFVQSGTQYAVDDPSRLSGIASLYYEPLWIFQTGDQPFDRLTQLAGKRLAIGAPASGTNAVVVQLLALNGIDAGAADFRELSNADAVAALLAGEVDVAFFVSSPDADSIRELVTAPTTRLVSIKRHRAYVRNVLFVKDLQIPEGTLDLQRNIPSEDVVVLSTLATAVCRADLHPAIVELFARTARKLHSGRHLLEQGGEFPSPDYLEFPIHEAASDYFQSGPSLLSRYLPFWLAGLIKRLIVLAIPLITLMIPLMKIAPMVYRAAMRRRIHRWYDDLDQIETAHRNAATAADAQRAEAALEQLERDVDANVEVPTSFRHDEYDLRMHLSYMREHLTRMRNGASDSPG